MYLFVSLCIFVYLCVSLCICLCCFLCCFLCCVLYVCVGVHTCTLAQREDFASARERSSLQPPAVLAYAYTDKRRSVMSPRKGVPSPRPAPLNVASPRRYTSTTPRRQGSATTPRRQGAGPTTPRRQGTGAPSPRPQGTGVPSPRRRGTGAPSPRKGASMGSPPRSRRGRLGQADCCGRRKGQQSGRVH